MKTAHQTTRGCTCRMVYVGTDISHCVFVLLEGGGVLQEGLLVGVNLRPAK